MLSMTLDNPIYNSFFFSILKLLWNQSIVYFKSFSTHSQTLHSFVLQYVVSNLFFNTTKKEFSLNFMETSLQFNSHRHKIHCINIYSQTISSPNVKKNKQIFNKMEFWIENIESRFDDGKKRKLSACKISNQNHLFSSNPCKMIHNLKRES